MEDAFADTLHTLSSGHHRGRVLSEPFLRFLPVAGAAVSTLGGLLGSETLSATDSHAARIDEIQFDLGEGPCWDAHRHSAPIDEPDFRADGRARWPAFFEAVRDEPVRAIFAYPLTVGTLRIGAVDLYCTQPMRLNPAEKVRASALADAVSRSILRDTLDNDPGETELNPLSRRAVHHATGIVLAQLAISPDDAHLIIQGHAFATGMAMLEVAEMIVDGRLRFRRNKERIEVADD